MIHDEFLIKQPDKIDHVSLETEKYFRELKQNFLKAEAYHKTIPIQAIKYLRSRWFDKDYIIKCVGEYYDGESELKLYKDEKIQLKSDGAKKFDI